MNRMEEVEEKLKEQFSKFDAQANNISKLDTQVNIQNIKLRDMEKKSTHQQFIIIDDLQSIKKHQA